MRLKILILISAITIILAFSVPWVTASHFNVDFLNLDEDPRGAGKFDAYEKIRIKNTWELLNIIGSINLTPVNIGIIDTGIAVPHPEFLGVKIGDTPIDVQQDRIIVVGTTTIMHGTNVAGIIGANNISAASPVNYQFPHMNGILGGVKNLDYTLEVRRNPGVFPAFSILSKISNLRESGSKIINFSNTKFDPLANATLFFKFKFNPDILFVVAAGNDGFNAERTTPANLGDNLDNVMTVGASKLDDTRHDFSNFGSAVNIAAPGQVWAPNIFKEPLDLDDYLLFPGTSASAPMVTGVAGLIKAINPNLTPAQIKQILVSNADPIKTDKPIGGRLNALKAICDPLVGLNCAPTPPPQLSVWPMFQKDVQRTGLTDVAGPAFATSSAVTVKWQKSLNIPSNFPPLVDSQAVYVGIGNNLMAIDKTNGNQIWQANIPAGAVNGAIGPDGTIYVCGLNLNNQSTLTAVNHADGAIKWQFIVGSFRPCNDPAISQNGIIYTTVPPPLNIQVAVVVAINPDGTEKWRHEEGNTATTPPALSSDESQVYVGFRDDLKAFNAQNGQILWNQSVPVFPLLITVDPQDRVLNQTLNGPIIAFSKSGNFLWQSGNVSALSLYPGNKIFTANPSGFAFLNAIDGSFVSSGSWSNNFQLPGHAFPIVDKDGLIYIPLAIFGNPVQIRLFALEGNGNIRWNFDVLSNLNIAAIGGSALNDDGTLYLLAQGLLFAF